jgi:hypothetical protein
MYNGAVVAVIAWYMDIQLSVQPIHMYVPITIKVASSESHSWRVRSIQTLCDKVCQ